MEHPRSSGDVPDAWTTIVLDGWERGRQLGAVGPGPVAEHLDHARRMVDLVPRGAAAGVDLGSGAGIPGLALAGLRPEMRWVLIDASQRRIRLVQALIDDLGWSARVEARHARAEEAARDERLRHRFDVVTARSFGPPPVTAECAAPFLREGGRVLVADPPAVADDRWPVEGLAPLGLAPGERTTSPSIQVLESVGRPQARFPRQPGVAARRPLW